MSLIENQYPELGKISNPFLEVKNVHKSFNFKNNANKKNNNQIVTHDVLSGVNLSIRKAEFVTVVGPSGCGKSTLLNILAGLDRPDTGHLLIDGQTNLSKTKRIVVFQEGALFPWLSVRENVEFGLKITDVPLAQRHKIVDRYLDIVGLDKFSDSYVHQLSGGMKQRVSIARALAMDPEILLMDEPFAALDVQTRELMYDELIGIHKTTGKTILFVTHNINEAILLGDRVIVLSPRLKNVKKEFFIDLPRPRDAESPELYDIKRQILKEFEEELQIGKS
jgi:NitT/TauT family transport system ATP-binding protein